MRNGQCRFRQRYAAPVCSGEIVEVWLGHRTERLTVSVPEERKDNGTDQVCEHFHGDRSENL